MKIDYLFNPFQRIAGMKALLVGTFVIALLGILGWLSNTIFDGALDCHYVVSNPGLPVHFAYQLLGVGSLLVFLWLAALIFSKSFRFIDIAGTALLSRFPLLLVPVLGFFVSADVIGNAITQRAEWGGLLQVVAAIFLGLLVLVWHLILLFNAFKVSTGLKGATCGIVFTVSVLLAEIASKVAIKLLI